MAKKKTGLTSTLFRDIDPYGGQPGGAGEEQRLPLAAVRPDPQQPRRILPRDLSTALEQGDVDPSEALRQWVTRSADAPPESLRRLRQLADSIARHGLINAVTVRRAPETLPGDAGYLLVTGERRFWAHVLLLVEGRHIRLGEERITPNTIRAHEIAPGVSIRAHQLIENLLREDINAVEKARGFWALRYEMSGVNYSSPGEVNEDAADLVPWRAVADALGVSKRYRIFVTNVLTLPPEAQALVDEHDLPEVTIRPIVHKLRDKPQLQLEALEQLVTWRDDEERSGSITRAVNDLVTRLLAREKRALSARMPDSEETTRRFRKKIRGALGYLRRLNDEERLLVARDLALDVDYQEVVGDLRDLRDQLNGVLSQIDAFPREE